MLKKTIVKRASKFILSVLKAKAPDIINYVMSKINKRYGTNIEVRFRGDITNEHDLKETDYILGNAGDVKSVPKIKRNDLYVFNQGGEWRTRMGCVVVNWYLMVCNNTGKIPKHSELHEWLNYFESLNIWEESKGASIPKVNEAGRKRWNQLYPDNKIKYYRMFYDAASLKSLLKKGYEVQGGRYTFSEYTKDVKDGRIDKPEYLGWKARGGHSLNVLGQDAIIRLNIRQILKGDVIKHIGKGVEVDSDVCVNSYAGRSYNIYQHPYLQEHAKEGIWFKWFYCVLPEAQAPLTHKTEKELANEELMGKFLKDSKFANVLLDELPEGTKLPFSDFKDNRPATIADVKELLVILSNRLK